MKIIGLSMPPQFFQFLKSTNRSDEIKNKILKLITKYPWISDLYQQTSVMSTVSLPDDLAEYLEDFGKFRSEIVRLALILENIDIKDKLMTESKEENEP